MNWADSSDEESDDELHPARIAATTSQSIDHDLSYDDSKDDEDSITGSINDGELEVEEEKIPYPPPINMKVLPENFPREAPFTAHVKNVAFNIKSEEDLGKKIEGLVKFRYQGSKRVQVTGARFGIDRQTGKRRGFSYVEFGTAEELMLFLNLNDGHSLMHGRPLSIDIARPPSSNRRSNNDNNRRDNRNDVRKGGGENSNIDGSKFRGGIRRNNNDDNNKNDIDGGKFRGGFRKNNGSEPRERTSLKLAPRSKPVDDGKPSNGNNWRSHRETPAPAGGRGRGGGRGQGRQNSGRGGRGKSNNPRNGKGNVTEQTKPADKPDSAPTKEVVPAQMKVAEEKKSVTKVSNAFAAFAFDSDSE